MQVRNCPDHGVMIPDPCAVAKREQELRIEN
jgi:hypothetical protein